MSETLDASSHEDRLAAPSREVAALVRGEPLHELPEDLYIPPEALRVFLETFEGPLDLLLYLIRRQNLDILAINVAAVTHQYIEYVELMEVSGIDLAAEYLLMAAMLAEIKSRSLLPRPPASEEDEDEDPTAALVRRLQEYEQLKQAAEGLDELPREGRDWFPAAAAPPTLEVRIRHPDVELSELLGALSKLMQRADFNQAHTITREALSTRERMMAILDRVSPDHFTPFEALFTPEEGRAGVVVTFMALLELTRERLIELIQNAPLSPIHVRGRATHEFEEDEGEGAYEGALSVAGAGERDDE
ncbi:segregation and condensation protein A [Kushneria phosphatilytica]|uniref:Segregation and condensation protein A n=1 Tax=Kushneria phosphatilytica TaxID=657387 RepID=A0A1S1NYJ9_9GAMM|nr:ScpA family protein [Kushneria phosphatilytica]OHV13955.1 segregation/condensation protein A [Kushneria phosphatilytica]QEL10517.1 segregation/condensation protein A [Kushneria phosphatilytica]